MSNTIIGQVAHINQPVQNGNYTSQTVLLLVEPGQYQSYIEVQFGGNSMNLIQNLQLNLTYTFHVNIRGVKQPLASTKTPGAYIAYTNLQVWKVEAAQNAGMPQQPAQQPYTPPAQQGGFMGAPQAQPQQGFPQQHAAPQQGFPQPGQPQGFPAPNQQPAPVQQPFGQPAANTGQPFGNPAPQGFPQQWDTASTPVTYPTQAEYIKAREEVIAQEQLPRPNEGDKAKERLENGAYVEVIFYQGQWVKSFDLPPDHPFYCPF